MADNNEGQVLSQEQQQQAASRQELDRHMNIALNGALPENSGNGQSDNNSGGLGEQGGVGGSANQAADQSGGSGKSETVTSIQDLFAPIKEKFGYTTAEDAIKEIEELRGLKANPTPSEIKFENDKSEKIFKALKEGKHDEVFDILAKERQLNQFTTGEINEANAESIIKLGMKLKFEDLSDDEIDYKFKKQYSIPKEPVQSADELDEDFAARKAQWQEVVDDVKMNKLIDAKLAKPELEIAKSKLVYPDINSPVDEEYLNYKKMVEDNKTTAEEISKAYQTFTPESLEKKVNFNDEPNKIAFEFQYKPGDVKFKEAVELASDLSKLLDKFKNQDGTPDRKGFLEFVYFGLNKDEALLEAMKQSKNAAIKANLPDNSNGGLNRQNASLQEPSELHKQMQMAGIIQ